jgi:hypothetical protein
LQRLSGLTRGTLVEALRILTGKMHGGFTDPRDGKEHPPIPLIAKGAAAAREPTWYGPDPRALGWYFFPDFLNDRSKFQQLRLERWPWLALRGRPKHPPAAPAVAATPWQHARRIAAIRDRRKAAGLPITGKAIGEEAGVSQSKVSNYLRIVDHATLDIVTRARVTWPDLDLLNHNALYEALKHHHVETRIRYLSGAVERAKGGQR